ncbi:MAG: polyphosphate polymerase domain-containing protein [Ruminococcus sp.]|nr:polyphosphate polymerase domain-containing protein [Ruminococcus sp.]
MLNADQYDAIINGIFKHMSIDKYGETTICNIYFDSSDNKLINLSIDKPIYKEKLRLRSYGEPKSEDDTVFFEIKKKYKGTVYKRRIPLSLKQARSYIETGEFPTDINSQIAKEIDYMVKFWDIRPKIFLAYERTAWRSTEDPGLRITFDKNIRYRYENVSFENGTNGTLVIPPNTYVMEIKIPNATPLWLSALLSNNNIFSHSFSKYGTAYINSVLKGDNNHV